MKILRPALIAVCILLPGISGDAGAQQGTSSDDKYDLNRLKLPIVPVPPRSKLDASTLDSTPSPYSAGGLQNPSSSSSQPAPGLRLTIPSRQ
jgi:hypothetical protein